MKKVLMISLGALTVLSLTVACPGSKHSAEECSPIVDEMLTNLTAGQKPEDAANIATMKATLVPVLQKECMSGKFDLTCLKSAKSIPAIQACKK
ncbi:MULTISPECIES: TIGR04454 family lipoprotein [Leptospira]|uniref:Lipoprotein n=2 Tax=Leptospira santarosai TaxID=28183 RepID=A0AB73MEV4_9LEPT|nr:MULTISPECIES: TIGR04454 family lipoprotein [Leptospira]ASV13557.1 TIGR04454 family lipoprotein [Leptospira santarosai]AVV52245.1 Putative lipoprotein [Leptospira santarosai]AVV81179.1 Putative lipoprotein [Leptospira santarosai]EKO76390.1 putative lipoprotein [Leptospira sp. Fiocruz LV3954]EKS07266.1 putative lipoprotein [Leptospira santarosai str. JET]